MLSHCETISDCTIISSCVTYSRVGKSHQVVNQTLLHALLPLSADHVTASFVESVHLLGRKIRGDLSQVSYDLVDEWLVLARLEGNKVSPALVGNLDERVASHVLNTLVRLVHELEELVDDSLQELPVCLEESRVLANNVHDVTSDNGLVVLATLHLGKA